MRCPFVKQSLKSLLSSPRGDNGKINRPDQAGLDSLDPDGIAVGRTGLGGSGRCKRFGPHSERAGHHSNHDQNRDRGRSHRGQRIELRNRRSGDGGPLKEINAAGGIDGRKITWVVGDTTSSPTGAETAVKDLIEIQGAFAVAELSTVFSPAAPYLEQAGIPVTGIPLDGPEWFEQPNTNMFSVEGNGTPTGGPVYSDGGFFKAIGAKKISYVEADAAAAITEGNGVYESIKRDGLQGCDKTIVPIGGVNFTAFGRASRPTAVTPR